MRPVEIGGSTPADPRRPPQGDYILKIGGSTPADPRRGITFFKCFVRIIVTIIIRSYLVVGNVYMIVREWWLNAHDDERVHNFVHSLARGVHHIARKLTGSIKTEIKL